MDRKTEHFVFSLLNKLKTTAAIIIVTHRVEIARFSDRIYVIEKGKISVSGSHVDLIKSNNIYCSIHNDLLGIKIN
jgi:ABC-type bacteriocin/lantibiotic exporter with double-glycine peptidase domain